MVKKEPTTIYLVGYYNIPSCEAARQVNLAASAKNDYLIESLLKIGYKVTVFSIAPAIKNKKSKETHIIKENLDIYFAPELTRKNRISRWFDNYFKNRWAINKIKKHCLNKTVIIYHSLYLETIVNYIKKQKTISLILEVEELYSDLPSRTKAKKKELSIISKADKYLFITPLLEKKLNSSHKPFIIYYGPYSIIKKETGGQKIDDNKIHLVYAGTADKTKGGLITALSVASYLPPNYVLHILSSENNKTVEEYITCLINEYKNMCSIVYSGSLSGEEFNLFLQKCDIGLALQNSLESFNASSFPSKTLTYLRNGLTVFSTKSISFDDSPFVNIINFVDNDCRKIAEEIVKKTNGGLLDDSRQNKILNELNEEFSKNLEKLINF